MKAPADKTDPDQAPVVEPLEPRLLYSADIALIASGFVLPDDDQQSPEYTLASLIDPENDDRQSVLNTEPVQPVELVFVGSDVPDAGKLQQLIKDAAGERNTVVYSIDSDQDGIETITEVLQQHENIGAVHILTHGSDAGIKLGDVRLNAASLDDFTSALSGWNQLLSNDTDILFYGCDYAGSAEGEALLSTLAELTGADISASVDRTGHADLEADWELEYEIGEIETEALLSAEAADDWKAVLASIVVDTNADLVDVDADLSSVAALDLNPGADGLVSLREAILAANASADVDDIVLQAQNYVITGGEMVITNPLSISGDTAANTIIDAADNSRIFNINLAGAGTVSFSDLTFKDGNVGGQGGAILVDNAVLDITDVIFDSNESSTAGGAIYTSTNTTMTITESVFTGNSAAGASGGAIHTQGPTTITGSEFISNTSRDGGAIYGGFGTDPVSIEDSRFYLNIATNDAGALYAAGGANIINSLFESNQSARDSGAVQLADSSTVVGSTFYMNDAVGHGGAIEVSGGSSIVDIESSTFVGNTTDGKGGAIRRAGSPAINVVNSLFADNLVAGVAEDIEGEVISQGFNLFETTPDPGKYTSAASDLLGVESNVGALGDNGGRWHTVSLNNDSPAINAGGSSTADATGLARNEIPDIGALEFKGAAPAAKIFWTDQNTNTIHRSDLDGSNAQEIYASGTGDYLYDLEVDTAHGYIYWIESGTQHPNDAGVGYIMRADFSGANAAQFEPSTGTLDMPMGLALDPDGGTKGYLYYIEDTTTGNYTVGDRDRVWRYDLDTGTVIWVTDELYGSYTDLEFDAASNKLFVTDYGYDNANRNVHIVDLADTSVTSITLVSGDRPLSVAVVPGGQEAYWVSALGVTRWTEAGGVEAAIPVATGSFLSGIEYYDNKLYIADFEGRIFETDTGVTAINEILPGLGQPSRLAVFLPSEVTARPTLDVLNPISVFEGGQTTLNTSLISFNDPDTSTTNIVYLLQSQTPTGGGFYDETDTLVTQFTQEDLVQGNIYFEHDDSENGPYDVVFDVTDGIETSSGHTATINVTPVNDAPTGTTATLTLDEDEEHTFAAGDFGFSDPEEGHNFLSVLIVNAPTVGTLLYNSAPVIDGQTIATANLGLLKYTPVANASGAAHTSFTFRVIDDGGTTDGGVDTDETLRTLTIDVTSLNDAPTGTTATLTIDEDEEHTFSTGDFGFSDSVEGHNFESVVIVDAPTVGTLLYNSAPVTDGQTISTANFGLLKYTPVANASGAAHTSFTFRVVDDGGTADGGVDTDETLRTLTIDVTSLNDAPTGTSSTLTLDEDEEHTFTVGDFGFADAVEGHGFESVVIVDAPTVGTLLYNSAPVTDGQTIPTANLGLLKYTPVANASGAGHASFTFRVVDDGGTADGGVNTDETLRTLTIDVTSLNDAPTGTSATLTLDEDEEHTFTAGDFGFADAVEGHGFESVVIVDAPTVGSLLFNSVTVIDGQSIDVVDLALLKYTPVMNASGAGHASFTFRVVDDGGTADGGVNTDETLRTLTIDVTSLNDAPTGTTATLMLDEDEEHTFTVGDFGFADAVEGHGFESVVIVDAPTVGTLLFNSVAVIDGQSIDVADLALLKYTPVAHASGAGHASFTFRVVDDGGTADGGVNTDETLRSLTIDVTSLNDAPTGTSSTLTLDEDEEHTFTVGDFGFADAVEGHGFESVVIVDAPTVGSLLFNSVTVIDGQSIDVADLALLKYTPVAHASGAGHASFTFRVVDDGGTADGGVNTDETLRTLTIDVTSLNDAPTGTTATLTLDEDEEHTFTVGDFGFADAVEGHGFESVVIVDAPTVGTLLFNSVAVIDGQSIDVADLALLKYTPVAHASGVGHASFTFRVVDDGGTADGGVNTDETLRTLTIDVTSLNDAPTGTSATLTLDEDEEHTFTAGDFGFADAVEGHGFESVVIVDAPTVGTLLYNSAPVTDGQTIATANLGLLKYTPVANASGAAHASFTFRVVDDGGTADGGVNTDETLRTLTIDVTSLNDAPTGTTATLTLDEDEEHTFSVGDFGFADAVEGHGFESVIIVDAPTVGTLLYNSAPVTDGQTIATANLSLLKYTPVASASGTAHASFTFRVVDDGGTADGGVNTDETLRTLTIDVTSLNDAPTGTSSTLTLDEDEEHTFTVGDFGFADAVESHGFESVVIVDAPTVGTLLFNSVTVIDGQSIDVADLALLKYTPVANASGAGHASFTFRVVDDGGTADGGVNTDETLRTLTIDVTSLNDAPTGTTATLTLDEDEEHTFTVGDFGFADAVEGHGFESVVIVDAPTVGTLLFNSVAVIDGQSIDVADLALLKYTPVAHASGAGHASFTFRVVDDGGTADGGVNTDETLRTLTIDVTSLNDAPTGTSSTLTLDEDEEHTFSTADFGFSDSVEGHNFESVVIVDAPTVGTLLFNSVAVIDGQSIDVADLALLKYTPVAHASGAGHASFTFRVADDGGTADGGVNTDETLRTLTVDVTAVNDAPSGQSGTLSIPGGRGYQFVEADFGYTDLFDGDAFLAILIKHAPLDGTLELGGVTVVDGDVIQVTDIPNLVYRPVDNAYGTSYATIEFQVIDDGGTTNGGVDTDTVIHTLTIDVIDPIHAPTIISASLSPIAEDAIDPAGQSIQSLFGAGFQDNDPGQFLQAIAVVENQASVDEGDWEYSIDGLQWLSIGDVSATRALVLDVNAEIRFVPTANFNGTPQDLQVKALDSYYIGSVTVEGAAYHLDSTTFGASGPISQDTTALSVEVTPVNDRPMAASDISFTTIDEDSTDNPGQSVLELFQTSYVDSLDQPNAAIAGIAVEGNFAGSVDGQWQYSTGGDWLEVGPVSTAQPLILGAETVIRFLPAENFNGTPGGLQVRALDDSYSGEFSDADNRVVLAGSLVNDLTSYAAVPTQLTISVMAVDDAPETLDLSANLIDENASGAVVGSVNVQDIDGSTSYLLAVDDPRFVIENGELRLAEGESLDFELESIVPLSLSVIDGEGQRVERLVELEVRDLNDTPALSFTPPDYQIQQATAYALPEDLFTDQDGDVLTYSVSLVGDEPWPEWLEYSAELHAFQILSLPDEATLLTFDVSATDTFGAKDTTQVVLQIAARPEPTPIKADIAPLENLSVETPVKEPVEVAAAVPEISEPIVIETTPEQPIEPLQQLIVEPSIVFQPTNTESYSGSDSRTPVQRVQEAPQQILQDVDSQSLEQLFTLTEGEVLESFANLSELMDQQYQQANEDARFANRVVGSTAAVTSGFSVGYILWLIRGGTLVGSVLSALPAWRFIDPLPILDSLDDSSGGDDGETLESMVEDDTPITQKEAQETRSPPPT